MDDSQTKITPVGFEFKLIDLMMQVPRDQHGYYTDTAEISFRYDPGLGTIRAYAGGQIRHYWDPPSACEAITAPEVIGDIE